MQVTFARSILAGAAVAFGLAVATPSTASAQVGFVVQGNYADDLELGVGGGVNFDVTTLSSGRMIRGEATLDYYFDVGGYDFGGFGSPDATAWEINANGMIDITSFPGLYAGAGAHLGDFSFSDCDLCESDSELGLNILAGWKFSGAKGPFVQAKLELGGFEQLVITGGVRF